LSNYYSPRRGNDIRNVAKIWEVARATSAASAFFDPIKIGGETFRDGGTGANNPIFQVYDEAVDIFQGTDPDWKLEDHLKCVVSIGTGMALLQAFGDTIQDVGKALVAISTNSALTANKFQQRHNGFFKHPSRIAFRFDVTQGLEEVGLEESEKIPTIEAATRRYISSENVFENIGFCAQILRSTSCTSRSP
jgi:predicted acylesterase/phospholipase RssA